MIGPLEPVESGRGWSHGRGGVMGGVGPCVH